MFRGGFREKIFLRANLAILNDSFASYSHMRQNCQKPMGEFLREFTALELAICRSFVLCCDETTTSWTQGSRYKNAMRYLALRQWRTGVSQKDDAYDRIRAKVCSSIFR